VNLLSALLAGLVLWLFGLPAVRALVAATRRWPLQVAVHPLVAVLALGCSALLLFWACRWLLWLAARPVRRALEHVPHPPVATQLARATQVVPLREVERTMALLAAGAAAGAVWTQGWRPAGTWFLLVLSTLFGLLAISPDQPLPLVAGDERRRGEAAPAPVTSMVRAAPWAACVWNWEPEAELRAAAPDLPWCSETIALVATDEPGTEAQAAEGTLAQQLAEQLRHTAAGTACPDRPAVLAAIAASAVVQAVRTAAAVADGRRPSGRQQPLPPGLALAHGLPLDRQQVAQFLGEVVRALGLGCDVGDGRCGVHVAGVPCAVIRVAPDGRHWTMGAGDAPAGD
jgi:hypothetical protein